MALTDTSSSRVGFVRGVDEPSGAGNLDFCTIPVTNFTLKEALTSAQSASMRPDGQMAGSRLVRGESAGDVGFEMAYGFWFDEIISGVLRAGAVFPASPTPGDDDILENAQTDTFFFFEERIEASSGYQYWRFQNCQINTFTLELQANSLVSASIGVIGLASTNGTAELALSDYATNAYDLSDQMDTNSATITMTDQSDTPITATFQSATLTIDNQMRGQQAIAYFYNAGNAAGRFKVTVSAQMYFESMALYDEFKANTGVKFGITLQDTGTLPAANSYTFQMNNLKIQNYSVDVGGADQDVIASVEFMGEPALTGTEKTITVTRHTST